MAELTRPRRRPARSFEQYVEDRFSTDAKRAKFNAARERVRAAADLFEVLEACRSMQNMSKAAIGRHSDMHATAVSRLFNDADANPTIETIVELLAALDLHGTLTIEPRSTRGRRHEHVLDVKTEFVAAG